MTYKWLTSGISASTHVSPAGITSTSVAGITVHISGSSRDRTLYDKSNYCVFCERPCLNLRKHLQSVHKSEKDIQLLVSFPKHSRERGELMEKLRHHGNYKHSCSVIRKGYGELIPVRSPAHAEKAANYVPCEHCLGFFLKKELWKHVQNCSLKSSADTRLDAKKGRRVIGKGEMLLPSADHISDELKAIITSVNMDEVGLVATRDPLIIAVAKKIFQHKPAK